MDTLFISISGFTKTVRLKMVNVDNVTPRFISTRILGASRKVKVMQRLKLRLIRAIINEAKWWGVHQTSKYLLNSSFCKQRLTNGTNPASCRYGGIIKLLLLIGLKRRLCWRDGDLRDKLKWEWCTVAANLYELPTPSYLMVYLKDNYYIKSCEFGYMMAGGSGDRENNRMRS